MANLPALYVTIYFMIILVNIITLIICRYRGSALKIIYSYLNKNQNGYFRRNIRCITFYTPFLNKIAIAHICDVILNDKNRTRFLLAIGTRIILFSLLLLMPSAIKYSLEMIYMIFIFCVSKFKGVTKCIIHRKVH